MVLRSAASRVLAGAGLVAGVALAPVAMAEKGGRPIFDPDALERAEKALKEIASSPYGKQVLDIARQQEVTKMQESKEHEQEHKRTTQQIIREMEHIRAQEERQLQEQRQQVNARMKQYEDELTRKRMMSDHELQRQRNAELVRLQEDAKLRGEQEKLRVEQQIQQERRSAQEYAAELQKQVEREKMLAEAEGRIRERRENEDIQRRAALLKYSEETKKALESINAVMGHLGTRQ